MSHKVLVVDDDVFSRRVLKKFLRTFPCTVLEAEDGLQALALIATESPDLVFLDVWMPVLDGVQTLTEIRSSPACARLPVVSVSSDTEKSLVMKLIDLGLAGFLVKPLRPGETLRRLEVLFQRLKNTVPDLPGTLHTGGVNSRRKRLLLVDSDPNFREFARAMLDAEFEVLEAATGAVGYQMFLDYEPPLICVGERLELPRAERLVQMIRATRSKFPPRIFLFSEGGEVPPAHRLLLDGVIRQSFIPGALDRELRRMLLGGESSSLVSLLQGRLRSELITATQQSIGVMTSQDVLLREEPAQFPAGARMLHTSVELFKPGTALAVQVEISLPEADTLRIASKILGAETGVEDGAGEAVAELVSAIAGRVCASMATRGFRFEQAPPRFEFVPDAGLAPRESDTRLDFETTSGERFSVAVSVTDSAAAHDGVGRVA